MKDEQREVVTTVILNGPLGEVIDASQGTIDDKALVQVVRAGILSANGNFSCMLSQWHYCNTFYHRPTESPASLEDLMTKAVQSMSSLRLKQSCDHGKFTKEVALQHLFFEALTLQLHAYVSVCPELNTFAKDSSGNVITGELDFVVGGKLSWAIGITRKGDKINQHVSRFDPNNGKYRAIGHSAWIVVDCRGPRVKQVESKEARCTLYFAENFQTADPGVKCDFSCFSLLL
ncbi:hypothetical protein SEMRO_761_G198600.1 [Seminavis robusta]|uniref:Uncharacterized protein n=1 Tax=Seminavis robusta TaxID=568900 RepID=A0A9N8HJE9_9STRA|nr:hypothetical protein SEMRO_761_G198600.1 [Seminavis robusta]|eukprot:Sro761_g198600.1 n/a (232) ;mRNA; r:45405-46100